MHMINANDVNSNLTAIEKLSKLIPWRFLSQKFARLSLWCDRNEAIRIINRWTPEEAEKLGFYRCDNDPHGGKIVYYEEHGNEERVNGIFKKLKCPECGFEKEQCMQKKNYPRKRIASPYVLR